jgi:hypothetical protein
LIREGRSGVDDKIARRVSRGACSFAVKNAQAATSEQRDFDGAE